MYLVPERFEQPQRSGSDDVGCILGFFEADANMRLGREVVNLVGHRQLQKVTQARRARQVAVVKMKGVARHMGIGINMIEAVRVKSRSPANDAVNRITPGQLIVTKWWSISRLADSTAQVRYRLEPASACDFFQHPS